MFSVIKIANKCLTERYSPSLFNFFYETFQEGFFIAELNHKITGFIIGVKIGKKSGRILMLAVLEKYRRQKIGTNLLNRLIENMIKDRIEKLELEVRTDNETAIQFYQQNNFEITYRTNNFYQNGDDAYIMRKKMF